MADRFFRDLEKPKYPHLVRPGGGLSGEMYDMRDDISRAFDRVDLGCASQTAAETHVYVDATTGDDSNDGSSWANALKTITAGRDALPSIIRHNTCLHLRGTFEDEDVYFGNIVMRPGLFLIDGGDERTVLSGPHTADISSTTTIGLSTLSLTTDEFAGNWVEILDGPAAGQVRPIHNHDATTFKPAKNFLADPGNASFRIVRPATTLQKNASWGCRIVLETSGMGGMIQQLHLGEGGTIFIVRNGSVSHVVSNDSGQSLWFIGASTAFTFPILYDPGTFAYDYQIDWAGFSQLHDTGAIFLSQCGRSEFSAIWAKKAIIERSQLNYGICYGSRVKQVEFYDIPFEGNQLLKTDSGYHATWVKGSADVGVLLSSSRAMIGPNVEILDCGSHAIEVRNKSFVKLNGNVKGSGNTGAGVYIHSSSVMQTKSGTKPTITGTLGDCSLDGSAGVDLGSGISDFWTDIESGSQVDKDLATNKEFCIVKKV